MPRHGSHQFKAKVYLHTSMATGQTQVHQKCTHKPGHRDTQVNANMQTVNGENEGHPFSSILTYSGRSFIQLPSTMVGHNNSLNSMFHCQLCIFSCQDAFNDDGQACQAPQPVDVIPGD